MLIQESYHDVPTTADGQGTMRMYPNLPRHAAIYQPESRTNNQTGIYVFHPTIPGYPNARFPGVVVFSEIYQGGTNSNRPRSHH